MRTQYILVDYENVQPASMAALDQHHLKVIVFVGAGQAKVSFEVADALQGMGQRARYVKIAGSGPNALDFHIAYYMGQLAAVEPDAEFHVISNDTGFDPLILHLNAEKISARRLPELGVKATAKPADTKTPSERQSLALMQLKKAGTAKPRTLKTLSNWIRSLFQDALPESEVVALLQWLQAQKWVSVTNTKVAYASSFA